VAGDIVDTLYFILMDNGYYDPKDIDRFVVYA
jgi:hypothetical protein